MIVVGVSSAGSYVIVYVLPGSMESGTEVNCTAATAAMRAAPERTTSKKRMLIVDV